MKDEGLNPTGTFKARGSSACISKLKELGVRAVAISTAGNAGGALSCYGARAGIQVHVPMPFDAPNSNKKQCLLSGANVHFVDGGIDLATDFISTESMSQGWFNASTFKEPWRLEGKKTMGFELFEQFSGDLPDVILFPTGGGVGLLGIWKAFQELEEMLWLPTNKKPRIYSVQAEGSQRLKKALDEKKDDTEAWRNIRTNIPGLSGPAKAVGESFCLKAIRENRGGVLAVRDFDAFTDMKMLAAMEGEFICH